MQLRKGDGILLNCQPVQYRPFQRRKSLKLLLKQSLKPMKCCNAFSEKAGDIAAKDLAYHLCYDLESERIP